MLDGAPGGADCLERALASAREHGLLYDELLCLRAIIAAGADNHPVAVGAFPPERIERAQAEHDALVGRLGVVRI